MGKFYSTLTLKERVHFVKRKFQLFFPYKFAHHPLCAKFAPETFKLKHFFFCRGCTEVYLSTIISAIFNMLNVPFREWSLPNVFLLVIAISFPTWFALFYQIEKRWAKDLVRVSLGIALGISIGEIIIRPELINKIIIFICITAFFLIFKLIRKKTSNTDKKVCNGCQQLEEKVCDGYKLQFNAELQFSREISDYIQKKVTDDRLIELIEE